VVEGALAAILAPNEEKILETLQLEIMAVAGQEVVVTEQCL